MSTITPVYRFLKARENINENAALLATIIEAERNIDAVELDIDTSLDNTKKVLDYSDLSYCLLNVGNHLLLLYPNEEREKYFEIQPLLTFGGSYMEYKGFTYSEAIAVKEFLDASEAFYKTEVSADGKVNFAVSEQDKSKMNAAVDLVKEESDTKEGFQYLEARNVYWRNTIDCVSSALNYDGITLIGSNGGAAGIKFDAYGAYIYAPKKAGRLVSRNDAKFKEKIVDAALKDLRGGSFALSIFQGNELTEEMTKDITRQSIKNMLGMSKGEILNKLELNEIPTIEEYFTQIYPQMQNYDNDKLSAAYMLGRMILCRSQNHDELKVFKMNKDDRKAYEEMHKNNVLKIQKEFSKGKGQKTR